MKKFLRIASVIMVIAMLLPYSTDLNIISSEIKAFAQTQTTSATSEVATPPEASPTVPVEETKPNFTFPEEMRAATIIPGKDFFKDENQSAETTQKEIDKIIGNISSFQMDTLIIHTNYNDKAYFSSSDGLTNEELAVKMLIDSAKKSYLFVYVSLNINFVLNQFVDTDLETRINFLTHISHKFSREYLVDGIILDGYYSSKSLTNYSFYMNNGSGIGFENWLLENGAYVFSLVSNSIHMTDNTIPVGICISNAWANSSTNEAGSKTNDSFQALTDGFSDTVSYIKNGFADFIVLNDFGSIDDPNMPFKDVASWWSSQAVTGNIPLFVSHANEKICTSEIGWISQDQILKQLIALKSTPNYRGSAFNCYTSLAENTETTGALVKYYEGKIDENSLLKELTMNSPTKTNFTTNEPSVKFQGSYDKNFDVYFNGKPIVLNEAGNFYYEEPLNVGLNVFQIKNKAKTVTYKITRNIQVLQSIEPTGNISVEGKTNISVSAIAYKGSKVTATFNGSTITLAEVEGQWEGSDPNSSYTKFTGAFSTPGGIVFKEQNLGSIVVNGSFQNSNHESRTGGTVIINALPEGINPAQLIKVTTDNALTYDYNNTSRIPSPTNPRLPAGTLDYYLSKVSANGIEYYLTASGKRIKVSDATVIDGYTFGENGLSVVSSTVENLDTVLKLKMNTPIPINVKYQPCSYFSGSSGAYYINNFVASSVVIEFDYITNVGEPPTFAEGSIFNSASWTTTDFNGRTRYQLNLNLTRAGMYSGLTSSYSSDGILTLKFNGNNKSLAGSVIVIDPGHGVTASGGYDPGAVGQVVEQKINIAVARQVAEKLKAQGATVYMLPTDTTYLNTATRSDYARQYNPDMFIAIHCNSASAGVRGTEAFYFMPFSQPLAKAVSNNISSYFTNNVYSDGANKNRGDKWDYFYVTLQHDFPSILVELAFVTNMEEAMALANTTHQNGIADALVNGISEYFSR